MATTIPWLFAPPTSATLPLSKGGDCVIDFTRIDDNGNPVNYDVDATLTLTIDAETPVTATAAIQDEHAITRIESEVADTLKSGLMWRAVVSLAGAPSTEIVVRNGTTKRKDK